VKVKAIAAAAVVLCVSLAGHWLLHVSTRTMLLSAAFLFVLAMIRVLWRSERAYQAAEHLSQEHWAKERESERASQRDRDGY
jgi:uncharacterized membrane protein YhhN